MVQKTFLWHDYETFGILPGSDRPVQFAAIRTDEDLNIVDEPINILARPADDFLPNPEACLVTGLSPQMALDSPLNEREFMAQIHHHLSQANTCTVGYNNLRFDDEFTRFSLFRNFFDPYAREWQNGNSRWDLLDVVRMYHALRPEGINWPKYEDGRTSFRLEDLSKANGISHENAHDALADVYATIEMARCLKNAQPRLFDFCLSLRNKQKAAELLNLANPKPLVHVSGMYPPEQTHLAVVFPIMAHPSNKNGVIVYDLRHSPEDLATLESAEIKERLYTKREDLEAQGLNKIAIKTVHINKCPALAPLNTLDEATKKRLDIDLDAHKQNLNALEQIPNLLEKLSEVFQRPKNKNKNQVLDPDDSLYSGGFLSPKDKQGCQKISLLNDEDIFAHQTSFQDERLDDMFFRFKARNFPEKLKPEEKQEWDDYRFHRMTHPEGKASIKLDEYLSEIERLKEERTEDNEQEILKNLSEYPQMIGLKV